MNRFLARRTFLAMMALAVLLLIPTEVLIAPSARLIWPVMLLGQAVWIAAMLGLIAGLLGRRRVH